MVDLAEAGNRKDEERKTRDGSVGARELRRIVQETAAEDPGLAVAMAEAQLERPKTRGDCLTKGLRPCPFVTCKYHLYLDVHPTAGSLQFNFPDRDVDEIPESCALDVADRGGVTLDVVGRALNFTRERSRQIETLALRRMKKRGRADLQVFGEDD